MRRAMIVVVVAALLAAFAPQAHAAKPRTLTRTQRFAYAGVSRVDAMPVAAYYGTMLPAVQFRPPYWTERMTISVVDASGLPVHFTTFVNNFLYEFHACGAAPRTIRFPAPYAVRVEPTIGFNVACAVPSSLPTSGTVIVTFSSR